MRKFYIRAETEPNSKSMDRPKSIIVGGGTGFVGTELVQLLRRKGYEVIVVSRTSDGSSKGRMTWDELESKGFPSHTVAVVNLAGQNVLDPLYRWTDAFKNLVYNSRIDSAKAFKKSIEKSDQKPDAFIQITGVGYYDPDVDKIHDESSTDGGKHDFLAKLVVDWEESATLENIPETRNVMIRSGVVLGRNGGMISQIFLPFFMGVGGVMGSGTQSMPWIHVKDLSGLILHSIENKNVQGVLNGVAPDMITNRDFVSAFAKELWRPAFIPLPEFVWNFVFGQERANMITKGPKVLPKRTLATGYNFRFPTISEACKEFSHLAYLDQD